MNINDLYIYNYCMNERKFREPFQDNKIIQDLLNFQMEFDENKINNTPFEECYKQSYFLEKNNNFLPCSYEEAIWRAKNGFEIQKIKNYFVNWSDEKNNFIKLPNQKNIIVNKYQYRLPPKEKYYTISWLDKYMKYFIINIEGQSYTIFALSTLNKIPEDPFPNINEKGLRLTNDGVVDYYNNYLVIIKARTWPISKNKINNFPQVPYYLYEKFPWC